MQTLLQITNTGFTADTFITDIGRVVAIAALICIGAYFFSEFKTWSKND